MAFTSNNGQTRSSLADINITPLVDVVLVLLIIFMVVVPLLMQGYNVDIPRSSADAVPAQSAEAQLILSVGPESCPILDQKISATELPGRVAEILGSQPAEKRVLFLAADDRLNYEGVLRIIDSAKSGLEDLKIEFIATN